MEIVVAGEADLGAARPAVLIEQEAVFAARRLVELDADVAAAGEQRVRRIDRQRICPIGRRADADRREVARAPSLDDRPFAGAVALHRQIAISARR